METQHIRFVRSVAEHGNISAAARELGMTQPALTKIIARLEDLVGARLFDRKSRGVAVTPFGEAFLERMARVEQEEMSLRHQVRAMKAGQSGTVSIGLGQFWLGRVVPEVLAQLTTSNPDVEVKVLTGPREDLLARLQRGDLDLVLGRITDDLPDDLESEPLAKIKLFLTLREGHPLAQLGRPVTPEDLGAFGWILPPLPDPTTVHIRSVFRKLGISQHAVRVEAVSQNLVVSLLQISDLMTAMPDIETHGNFGGLCRLEANWLEWSRSAGVIRHKERPLLPCCERFLGLLRQEM